MSWDRSFIVRRARAGSFWAKIQHFGADAMLRRTRTVVAQSKNGDGRRERWRALLPDQTSGCTPKRSVIPRNTTNSLQPRPSHCVPIVRFTHRRCLDRLSCHRTREFDLQQQRENRRNQCLKDQSLTTNARTACRPFTRKSILLPLVRRGHAPRYRVGARHRFSGPSPSSASVRCCSSQIWA